MQGKIDLAAFRDDDDDAVDFVPPKVSMHCSSGTPFTAPKLITQRALELTQLKSKTFSHGIMKKTKKDLEREAEEKKRIEEEKWVTRNHLQPRAATDGTGHKRS